MKTPKRKSRVKRFILGVTGGIASGKSVVLSLLARKRIPVVSSDALAHQCIRKGQPPYRAIVRAFGRSILDRKGEIDRRILGKLAFSSPVSRKRLERLVHPCVIRALRRFAKRRRGLIAMDIPLLFEVGLESLVDFKVVVSSTRNQQLRRMVARDKLSRFEALGRLKAQWPLRRKRALADYVISNTRDKRYLRRQVEQLLDKLDKLAEK